jgi:hypothetical protein
MCKKEMKYMDIDEIKKAWNEIRKTYTQKHPIEEYNENYECSEEEEDDHDCSFD